MGLTRCYKTEVFLHLSKIAADAIFDTRYNNFGVNRHTSTKLGGNNNECMWSDCKPEVKFQYVGRLSSESESSNNSAVTSNECRH